jgi:hypothetical protein
VSFNISYAQFNGLIAWALVEIKGRSYGDQAI